LADPAVEVREKVNDPHRLARVFLGQFDSPAGRRLRYWQEQFHEWKGGGYVTVPAPDMRARVTAATKAELDRDIRAALAAWAPSKEQPKPPAAQPVTSGLVGNVLQALAGYTLVPSDVTPPAWLDANGPPAAGDLVACRNGLLNLSAFVDGRPGCLLPATPQFFDFNATDFAFDPAAPPPAAWLDFLRQIWPDDPESIEVLQDWFGSALTPDTSLQKILLLVGPPRSGKGTIARVLRGVVGEANAAGPSLGSLGSGFGRQPLIGKPLAIISDARLSGRTDTAVVTERLLNVSGEDAVTIDRKHLTPVTMKLPTRFVFIVNELPRLGDASGALARRFIILRMRRSWIGQEDHALTARLLGELPSIFLWAVEGWRRLRDRGRFVQPRSAQ
jgi:putative DNA primase/helicase